MLGRLLSTFSNPSSRNPAVLESVTEEEHTSNLLFPDASLLRHSNSHAYPLQSNYNSPNASSAGGYDDRGGLELDPVKDFRFIIAQNAIGDRDEPCILLDSRAPPEPNPQGLGIDVEQRKEKHGRSSSHSKATTRRGSIQATHSSSLTEGSALSQAANTRRQGPPPAGAFSRARGRGSVGSIFGPSEGMLDTIHNRHTPDNADLGLLNCIFGSSAFSYRESSTKMHILSADSDSTTGTPVGSVGSPIPRDVDFPISRHGSLRRPMTRTYTSGSQGQTNEGFDVKPVTKVTVLITRMFSVNLPETQESPTGSPDPAASLSGSMQDQNYPFSDAFRRRKIREKKTPMYAVAITIQIPLAARHHMRPMRRSSIATVDGRSSGSMSFSFDSDRWSVAFLDDASPPPANLDDRIDLLVDHWDVITRTLSHLERVARREILTLLKKVDASVNTLPKAARAPHARANQKILQLRPNVFAFNTKLKEQTLLSAQRICFALRIPRVVIGQSRWGVWREEARWIARLMADKEHGLFFLVLITAFLGNHTEWLNTLGPEWCRRRHKAQQDTDHPILSNRTVIVSDNKMVARRLIFVLSAFLPAKQRFETVASPLRPGTSTPARPQSQSPPTYSILREESLRKTANRRAHVQRLNVEETDHDRRSVSPSSTDTRKPTEDGGESAGHNQYSQLHNRRDSDVRSIRTASFAINGSDGRTTATTSTTTNSSAMPVPHFATRQRQAYDRRSSGDGDGDDSYASAKLLQNLRRSEASGNYSEQNTFTGGSRWMGNLLTGFWSSRTAARPTTRAGLTGGHRRGSAPAAAAPRPTEGTARKPSIKETEPQQSPTVNSPTAPSSTETISIPTASSTLPRRTSVEQEDDEGDSQANNRAKESPLKLSVQEDDGVVDVELPLRGFVSSFSSAGSALTSPRKTRASGTSVDAGSSSYSSYSSNYFSLRDNDSTPNINVAGWLKAFHEDFLLQAVRPYAGLEADIKRAMLNEPTPPNASAGLEGDEEKWVDIASTLIADTRSCTVRRVRLRRRIGANGHNRETDQRARTKSSGSSRRGSEPAMGTTSGGVGVSGGMSNLFSRSASRSRKNSISVTTGISTTGTNALITESSSAAAAEGALDDDDDIKFIEEPIMDVDGTLVDAIERVLVQSGQSSLAHSRAPSPHRGSSSRNNPTTTTTTADDRSAPASNQDDTQSQPVEVPRAECRKMVLSALDEVVRSVAASAVTDQSDPPPSSSSATTTGAAPPASTGRTRGRSSRPTSWNDNILREGIRKWFQEAAEEGTL
ncbi:hypothetical protein VTN31DRAFT_262 [Thermomyces dupontii]|uniref:uncharacterized protein n=1 Tax=Talaromyces thermophilus TaxID=28565 RepID=UPI00374410CA